MQRPSDALRQGISSRESHLRDLRMQSEKTPLSDEDRRFLDERIVDAEFALGDVRRRLGRAERSERVAEVLFTRYGSPSGSSLFDEDIPDETVREFLVSAELVVAEARGLDDGSSLPDYTPGASLHRSGGAFSRRDRVHVTQTNDAEALADIWGTLADGESLTMALVSRLERLLIDNGLSEDAAKLNQRSGARLRGDERSQPGGRDGFDAGAITHYQYGHTGLA